MCLSIANQRPELVLAKGEHLGFEWIVTNNGRGYRCGYVKVEPGHPWHGKDESEIEAECHGGLTFGEHDQPCANPDGKDEGYWVGFDCNHCDDLPDPALAVHEKDFMAGVHFHYARIRTQVYVEAQCQSLCEQATAVMARANA